MPITQLIQERQKREGMPPTSNSLFGLELAKAWYQRYVDAGKAELAMSVEGASYRASWSGSCLRQIFYNRLGLPDTEPPTVADAWRFELGHLIHGDLQELVKKLWPDAQVEMKARFEIEEGPDGELYGATHIDLIVPDPAGTDGVYVVEIKSLSGYPYKLAATTFRGEPEGPKFGHMRQLAVEARAAIEAGQKVLGGALVYVSTELVSPDLAAAVGVGGEIGRFMSEWQFSVDELEEMAADQIAEFSTVEVCITEGKLAPRYIPEQGGVVSDPMNRGAYFVYDEADEVVGGGNFWGCAYCGHRTRCSTHPATGSFE